jgi:hypothetical protein
MKKVFYVFAFLLLSPVLSQAAEVVADVDRARININESVIFSVTIKDSSGDVDVSLIKDFNVISNGSSTSVQIKNGNVSKEITYNWTLVPLRKGELKIPSLTVLSGNDKYFTKEMTIIVSEINNNARNDSKDIFLTVEVSEPNPYAGQQFICTFKLHHAVPLTDANFQQPDFKGFSAKKAGKDNQYRTVIGSREYNVIELNYVLIGSVSGKYAFGPAILSCNLVRAGQRGTRGFDSFFDDPFFGRNRLEPITLSTSPVEIDVKPLPQYSEEIPFSGLVGKFNIQAELDNEKISVGDSTTVTITVSGTGNIMDAGEPVFAIPNDFKIYKDKPEEEINLDKSGYSGKRLFRSALVPVKEGNFEIGPVQMSYFDVNNNKYEVIKTRSLNVSVKIVDKKVPAQKLLSEESNKLSQFAKEDVKIIGRDILPIKEDLDAVKTRSILSFPFFLISLTIPFLFFLSFRIYFLFSNKSLDDKKVMANRANISLKNAKNGKLTTEEFLSHLYLAMVSAIFSKAAARGESLTYSEALNILTKSGCSEEIVDASVEIFKKIETARFGGRVISKEEKDKLLSELKRIIRKLL